MVYAYDLWAQMPTKDLYDSQMMLAAVNAAKDMYDKGELAIKEFRNNYGDFYTPTTSHLLAYDKEFNVSNFILNLYDAGIDPLRSSEGRGLINSWINTRPYDKYAMWKRSLDTYNTYLKNSAELLAKGLWNLDFVDYLNNGRNIENLNEDEIWDKLTEQPYYTLGDYTDNLFSGMKDEFIYSDPLTGLDWYGVSRLRRYGALTENMNSILSTDLGKFHYEQAKKDAKTILNRDPTNDEILELFKTNVLTETSKYDHMKPEENPEYTRKRNSAYSFSERRNPPEYDPNSDVYDFQERLYLDAIGNVFGTNYKAYDPDTMGKNIQNTQNSIFKSYPLQITDNGNFITKESLNLLMPNFIMDDAITPTQFLKYTGFSNISGKNGVYLGKADIDKLHTNSNIASFTSGSNVKTLRNVDKIWNTSLKNEDNLMMSVTGRVYGARMKDGVFHTYAEVVVTRSDDLNITYHVNDNDKADTNRAVMWYDLGIKSNKVSSLSEPQDLYPSWRNLHSRLTRSNLVNKSTFTSQTNGQTEFLPNIAQPNIAQ